MLNATQTKATEYKQNTKPITLLKSIDKNANNDLVILQKKQVKFLQQNARKVAMAMHHQLLELMI